MSQSRQFEVIDVLDSGNGGYNISVDIGPTRTTIEISGPDIEAGNWVGVGFSCISVNHDGAYAVSERGDFMTERWLGDHAAGTVIGTNLNWNLENAYMNYRKMSRDNVVAGITDFWPEANNLCMMYAKGSQSFSPHGNTNGDRDEKQLNALPTQAPTTGEPTTSSPTKNPTTQQPSNPPTTSQPTTNAPTTAEPTTKMPSTDTSPLLPTPWVIGDSVFPDRSNDAGYGRGGIGYYNGSIHYFGGYQYGSEHYIYDIANDKFSWGGSLYSADTDGSGQYYVQINDLVYYIHGSNAQTYIGVYKLKTKSLDRYLDGVEWNSPGYAYNALLGLTGNGCCAAIDEYLLIVGNNKFAIFNTSNHSFIEKTYPSTNIVRDRLSCLVHPTTNQLYVIGGIQNTIEKIDVSDIMSVDQKTWKFLTYNLQFSIKDPKSVVYKDTILIIGGYKYHNNGSYIGKIDEEIIIDVMTEQIWYGSNLAYSVAGAPVIVVDNIVYAFGGSSGSTYIKTWQYVDFNTNSPTSDTDQPTVNPSTSPSNIPSLSPITSIPSYSPTKVTETPTTTPTTTTTEDIVVTSDVDTGSGNTHNAIFALLISVITVSSVCY